jgi:thioredoxin-like negative regulator of GroEL
MPSYLPGEPDRTADQLLVAAQEEYLRGNWFEAEATLVALLQASPEDAEARLLLATLLRRTHKLKEARSELERLGQLDAAERWRLEIGRELAAIAELEEEEAAPADEEPASLRVVANDAPPAKPAQPSQPARKAA